jgi:hypothetical protein
VRDRLGQRDDAIADYERFLALAPVDHPLRAVASARLEALRRKP